MGHYNNLDAMKPIHDFLGIAAGDVAEPAWGHVSRVYFVQEGESSGPIKIGQTIGLNSRLLELKRHSPAPVTLLVSVPGGMRLERSLHRHYSEHRIAGEWFKPNDGLLALIALARELQGQLFTPFAPEIGGTVLTVKAAALLSVSLVTFHRWIDDGWLHTIEARNPARARQRGCHVHQAELMRFTREHIGNPQRIGQIQT